MTGVVKLGRRLLVHRRRARLRIELSKLNVEPGGYVLARIGSECTYLSREDVERLREDFRAVLPPDIRILVVPPWLHVAGGRESRVRSCG